MEKEREYFWFDFNFGKQISSNVSILYIMSQTPPPPKKNVKNEGIYKF